MSKLFFSHFQFQLRHQRVLFKFDLTFLIYGQPFKKLVLRILIACILRDLASSIASILKKIFIVYHEDMSALCFLTFPYKRITYFSTSDTQQLASSKLVCYSLFGQIQWEYVTAICDMLRTMIQFLSNMSLFFLFWT